MGRAKLPIKKIENTTNRQVTFSKRRNGIIKKAYELSVLCDVDVALIMFSPSGKASIFAGSGSIEEIITRYIHVPEHERGRLQNKEYLERVLGKLRSEAQEHQAQKQARDNSASGDSQLEELQQEINWCKSHMVEMEKKIRVYEGDASEISTVSEAEDREKILEEALKQVHVRKHVLKKYNSADAQSSSQATLTLGTVNVNNMVTSNPSNIFDWLPPREPQVQIVNFLNFGGLLSPRRNEHVTRGSVMESDNVQRAEFGQMLDMNLSPWALSYPTGNVEMGMLHAGDRVFNDAFLP